MTGNRHILKTVAVAAVLVMAAASCAREPFDYKGIHFKAKSVGYFGNPRTKTAYAGEGDGNVERIDWTDGDIIRIYSDKAYVLGNDQVHVTDYAVDSHTGDGSTYVSTATISPAELANALQWGSGTNTFYAMYPSPSTPGLTGAAFNAGEMTFPILAEPNLIKQGENLIYTPDMKYAPMLAKATATSGTSSVNLAFAPEYTAFEFTVSKGNFNEIHISNFTLTSTDASEPVSGVITIPAGEYADESAVTVTDEGTSISVDWATPVLLDEDHPNLTITVFTVPKTLSHLKISYTGTEITTRSLSLKNAGGVSLEFPARKKYRIYGLSFPVIVPVDNPEAMSWDYHVNVMDNVIWWMNTDVEPEGWEGWTGAVSVNTNIPDNVAWWLNTAVEPVGWDGVALSGSETVNANDNVYWWMNSGLSDGVDFETFAGVELSDDSDVYLWRHQTITRTAHAFNSSGDDYGYADITWSYESQPSTGVIDLKTTSGIVTALGPGEATVYAVGTPVGGGYPRRASYKVYVNAPTGITLTSADGFVKPSNTEGLTATVSFTSFGSMTEYPADLLEWSSATTAAITLSDTQSTPAIATGQATATANGVALGTSTITVSVASKYAYGVSATLADFPCEETHVSFLEGQGEPYKFRGKKVSPGILQYSGGSYSLTSELDGLASLLAAYGTAAGRTKHYFTWEGLSNEFNTSAPLGRIDETIYTDASSTEWRLPLLSEWAEIINNAPTATTKVGSTVLTKGFAHVVVNLDGSVLDGQGLTTFTNGVVGCAGNQIADGTGIDRTDYITGLLLIPDGATITCPRLDGTVGDVSQWSTSTNCITYRDLVNLVDGGCVFIPSAGYYSTGVSGNNWWQGGGNGYYWSAIELNSSSACHLYFYTGGVIGATSGVPGISGNVNLWNCSSSKSNNYFPVHLISGPIPS